MPNDQLDVLNQPICRHLLSKGMFVTGEMNPNLDAEHRHDRLGDSHCWCSQTQNSIGPDDGMVQRLTCRPGRQCFEGLD